MLIKCKFYYIHLKEEETEAQVSLFILAKQLVSSRDKTCREVIQDYC